MWRRPSQGELDHLNGRIFTQVKVAFRERIFSLIWIGVTMPPSTTHAGSRHSQVADREHRKMDATPLWPCFGQRSQRSPRPLTPSQGNFKSYVGDRAIQFLLVLSVPLCNARLQTALFYTARIAIGCKLLRRHAARQQMMDSRWKWSSNLAL
jgi:hypothetical protein